MEDKRIEINKKALVIIMIIGTLLILGFNVIQVINYSAVRRLITFDGAHNPNIHWDIETIKVDRNYSSIVGWAILPGEQQINFMVDIVIKNISTKQAYIIPSQMLTMEDLNYVIDDGVDYSNSGFFARVNNRLINLNTEDYDIFIRYRVNGMNFYVETGKVLSIQETD